MNYSFKKPLLITDFNEFVLLIKGPFLVSLNICVGNSLPDYFIIIINKLLQLKLKMVLQKVTMKTNNETALSFGQFLVVVSSHC